MIHLPIAIMNWWFITCDVMAMVMIMTIAWVRMIITDGEGDLAMAM